MGLTEAEELFYRQYPVGGGLVNSLYHRNNGKYSCLNSST